MRRRLGWVLMAVALIGCVPRAKAPTPAASVNDLSGDGPIVTVGTSLNTPTPTPRPSTTPIPTPAPTEDPDTYTPFAIGVTLTLDATSINLPPPEGETALYPFTTQAHADVLMSNGLRSSQVTWSASNPALVRIDASGIVTALGTIPGTVDLLATSQDGKAFASASLEVTGHSDLGVVVD